MHAVQESADALLVSIDEFGDDSGGAGLQCAAGDDAAAAVGDGPLVTVCVSCVVVGGQASGAVRLGAAGDRAASLGLPGVESDAAKGEGMVHEEAADAFTGGGNCADAAVVDTGGTATGRIFVVDWKISGAAGGIGVGGGVGGGSAAVRGCGVAGLFAGTWESAEYC